MAFLSNPEVRSMHSGLFVCWVHGNCWQTGLVATEKRVVPKQSLKYLFGLELDICVVQIPPCWLVVWVAKCLALYQVWGWAHVISTSWECSLSLSALHTKMHNKRLWEACYWMARPPPVPRIGTDALLIILPNEQMTTIHLYGGKERGSSCSLAGLSRGRF